MKRNLAAPVLFVFACTVMGTAAHASDAQGPAVAGVIEKDNAGELKKLLALGLDPDAWVAAFGGATTMPMLEYACRLQKAQSIKVLAEHGADLGIEKTGRAQLPIEILLEANRNDLAALLAKPNVPLSDNEPLEMIAVRVLRRGSVLLKGIHSAADYHAIKLNGKPISKAMLTILSGGEFDTMPELPKGIANEAITCVLDVRFADIFERDVITFRLETGGALSGGVSEGRYQLQFGYWLLKDLKTADK